MNTFMNSLKEENNTIVTENGATAYGSTLNAVLDLFALGGSYRNRDNDDCILLFKNAFEEDPLLALKCLFYLRDAREGQGEKRFFRVCLKWLAKEYPEIAEANLQFIPEFGRYDDWYTLIDTPLEKAVLTAMKDLFTLDMNCQHPSLLAKWLKSPNASSKETKRLAKITREYFGMTEKEYRKALSLLRGKIKVLEKLMSAGRWDEIEFDKIPSKAGLKYSNTFRFKDETAQRYKEFMESKSTKVNAGVLYPYDIAHQIFNRVQKDETQINTLQKYWDNLPDYYNGREENAIAIIDVSGSMWGRPLEAAVSLGAYIAERYGGPFANHFITFSEEPELVKFEGINIVDKFNRCKSAKWGMNTNIEAVFDMLLNIALRDDVKKEDMPKRLYIFSDMEFDCCINLNDKKFYWKVENGISEHKKKVEDVLFNQIAKRWEAKGYELPEIIFWNLDARQNNIPMLGKGISYISGLSPILIEQILGGKTGWEICLEKLNSERYEYIHIV